MKYLVKHAGSLAFLLTLEDTVVLSREANC